jgi:DNA-binding winged helix-turn-helix (wHTH) protein/TolB-like protein
MVYRFGVFEFDDDGKELRRNGRSVAIERQPAKALTLLVSRAGELVTRDELREAVWGKDTHVDFDRGLAYCVSQIRAALGDSGDNPRFVQTIPKQGFKFIAPLVTAPVDQPVPSSKGPNYWISIPLVLLGTAVAIFVIATIMNSPEPENVVHVAVSVFDNETGQSEYDRPVAGLSDLVVERLTKLDPERIAVVGNAAVLRRPRNIRNLKAVADGVHAEYVLLGQLQRGETGLRFITHFIRLRDEAHLKANRLSVADEKLTGLENAVVEEFERAVREHILNRSGN